VHWLFRATPLDWLFLLQVARDGSSDFRTEIVHSSQASLAAKTAQKQLIFAVKKIEENLQHPCACPSHHSLSLSDGLISPKETHFSTFKSHLKTNLFPISDSYWQTTVSNNCNTFPWRAGRSLIWDVTVSCTTADSYLEASSREAGAADELAASNKVVKYAGLSSQGEFIPIAVESHGSINRNALQFLSELGS